MIWVSDEVAMPVVTCRYVGRAVHHHAHERHDEELPLTALVGTSSTLLRLAIVTVSEPVMPDLARHGRPCGARSTVYSTVLDEPPAEPGRGRLAGDRGDRAGERVVRVAVDGEGGLLADLQRGDVGLGHERLGDQIVGKVDGGERGAAAHLAAEADVPRLEDRAKALRLVTGACARGDRID